MQTARLEAIAKATDELNKSVSFRGSHEYATRIGQTLGECDWLTELHRLLYEETNENF